MSTLLPISAGIDVPYQRSPKRLLCSSFCAVSTLALSVVAFVLAGCTETTRAEQQEEVHLWSRWEESFTAEEQIEEEIDLQLTVELTAPSGEAHAVPGLLGRRQRVESSLYA